MNVNEALRQIEIYRKRKMVEATLTWADEVKRLQDEKLKESGS